MKTTMITLKVDQTLKQNAQQVAEELGFSLSSLINGYLRSLVRTRSVHFRLEEELSDYAIQALQKAEEEVHAGKVSPTFTNAEDAIKWLNTVDTEV